MTATQPGRRQLSGHRRMGGSSQSIVGLLPGLVAASALGGCLATQGLLYRVGAVTCRRAVYARSAATARRAVSTAAPAAMRVICHPGMPPAITVWI